MDNMNNTQAPEPKENNKKLIIFASIGIAALVALFLILGFSFNWFGTKQASKKDSGKVPATINVVETRGSDGKTKKVKISVRDVKFGDKIKSVKKFEKTQKDTLDSPSEASTKDGYTYLTYTFSPKANFFGVKPKEVTAGGMLQYVFKNKKLFDIRIQFGDIGKKNIAKVEKKIKSKYGKETAYIKYSNDSYRYSWRSAAKKADDQTILTVNYSPQSGLVVAHERVGR